MTSVPALFMLIAVLPMTTACISLGVGAGVVGTSNGTAGFEIGITLGINIPVPVADSVTLTETLEVGKTSALSAGFDWYDTYSERLMYRVGPRFVGRAKGLLFSAEEGDTTQGAGMEGTLLYLHGGYDSAEDHYVIRSQVGLKVRPEVMFANRDLLGGELLYVGVMYELDTFLQLRRR